MEVAHLQSGSSSTWFLVELEFGDIGFWGKGKSGVPGEKTSWSKLNSHYGIDARIWTRATLVGGERLPLRHPLLRVQTDANLLANKFVSQQLPTFLLFCDRRSVAQQCWIRLQTSSNINCWGHARRLHMDFKVLWVVSFQQCTAGTNIVGSCCIRVHSTVNTHATTPNIVDPAVWT